MDIQKLSQTQVIQEVKNQESHEGEIVGLTEKDEKRIARLEKYVKKVEEAQKIMMLQAQKGEFEAFSEEDIRFHLSHDPDMIAEAGLFLAKLTRAYEYAKVDTQVILAQLWKECNEEKELLGLSNAKDREAWVKTQPRYVKTVRQEIEWKYHLNRMQVIYDRYENLFTGSRKIASMLTKEMYDHGI